MSASKIKNGPVVVREPYSRSRSLTFPSPAATAYNQTSNNNYNNPDGLTNESNNAITSGGGGGGGSKNGRREKGVIEKLLTSYGFVQCTERKGRFFFHYSEYKGNLNNLAIGDQVEFQESVDKRTGKPVAILIVKLNDTPSQVEILSGKAVEGLVLAEARSIKNMGSNGEYANLMDGMGRVTYEQGGETFFLPFAIEDMEQGQNIGAGDKVTFYLSTDERNGNIRARRVRKQSYVNLAGCPDVYQGVVCSMKDNYGFIERADVVKEIFFHFSEFDGDIDELNLGDDVEFGIQTRNNKDVAVSIGKLPPGTVIFEDVAKEWKRGKIKKTLKMAALKKISDALAGRIVYETVTGPIEIPFGEKDPIGDYTMNLGDIVEFCIATDRRDKVQHATNIRLVDDTFLVTKEKRERGFVTTLKEGFGFIRCVDREARMFFHFSELLSNEQEVKVQDELEFTVIQDPTNPSRQVATRIKHLPQGTIDVSLTCALEKYLGVVQKEAGNARPLLGGRDPDPGIIMYEVEGTKQMIPYSCSIVDGNLPKIDEKVEFQISECQKNKTKVAINVKVISSKSSNRERGFVVTIKEGFGFIETSDHEKEIYFHFSNYEGDVDLLDIGNEVEFSICNKSGRISAENIKRIPNKSIPLGEVISTILEGRVLRGIHATDGTDYYGLIQQINDYEQQQDPSNNNNNVTTTTTTSTTNGNGIATGVTVATATQQQQINGNDDGTGGITNGTNGTAGTVSWDAVYPFSIMSLVDKRETLMARGDSVRFQVIEVIVNGNKPEFYRSDSTSSNSANNGNAAIGVNGDNNGASIRKKRWAYRVASTRKFVQARIESLTETGGLLSYETDQGCKLTFSSKDVQNVSELAIGDEVEFVVLNNNGVKMAVNVRKASDRPRPERLISRIKSISDDQTQRVITTRQPRGPDGTRGFKNRKQSVSSKTMNKAGSFSNSKSTSDNFDGNGGNSCGTSLKSPNCNNAPVGGEFDAYPGVKNSNMDRAGGDVVTMMAVMNNNNTNHHHHRYINDVSDDGGGGGVKTDYNDVFEGVNSDGSGGAGFKGQQMTYFEGSRM